MKTNPSNSIDLYQDPSLTFNKIKKILSSASGGELQGKEIATKFSSQSDSNNSSKNDKSQQPKSEKDSTEASAGSRDAALKLRQIDGDHDLNIALEKMKKAGFDGATTIEDFLKGKLSEKTKKELPHLDPAIRDQIVDHLFGGEEKESLKTLTKNFPLDAKKAIKDLVDKGPEYLRDAIWPIEDAIHDFSVEMLKGLKSIYSLDTEQDLTQMKKEVENAIKGLQKYDGKDDKEIHSQLAKHLKKLKHHDNVNTAVGGIEFEAEGKLYKFTGNFTPVEHLLDLFDNIKETVNEAEEPEVSEEEPSGTLGVGTTIAVIPGKFKPPHKGHLEMVKHYNNLADRVVVLVSPIAVPLKSKNLSEISADLSVKIWQIYLSEAGLGNVEVKISEYNSPVRAAIEFGNDPRVAGSNILLGASTKDGDAKERFGQNLQKYAPDVNVIDPLKYACDPTECELGNMSASDIRDAIEKDDSAALNEYMPIEVRAKGRTIDVFNLLKVSTENIRDYPSEEKYGTEASMPFQEGLIFNMIQEILKEDESFMDMHDDGQTGEWSNAKKKAKAQKKKAKAPASSEEGDVSGETSKKVKSKVDQEITVTKKIKNKVDQEVVNEEELDEMSAMAGGAVAGGGAADEDGENNSLIREKEEIIEHILNYIV